MAIPPASSDPGLFPLGVASRAGKSSAILWTKTDSPGEFKFKLSTDDDLKPVVAKGPVTADNDDDFTIEKTVKNLDPGTRYYFQFKSDDSESDLGTFKTLPPSGKTKDINLALTGDSDDLWDADEFDPDPNPANDQERPFEVLDRIREEKPGFFIYMGDTMYSDSETGAPLAETIEEKWEKYRNNRALPASMAVLRKLSTWAVWDDHEVLNDFDGAVLDLDNSPLLNAGLAAFHDYWPLPGGPMYRKVNYGSKIDLLFLDERRYRDKSADVAPTPCRDESATLDLAPKLPQDIRDDFGLDPVDPACLAHLNDPDRTMLGETQLEWFKKQLQTSDARWKLVVNEVPIVELFLRPYDRWDGYSAERKEILSFIDKKNIRGVVFLTTDLHANANARVYKDITKEGAKPVAYEMVTGPIQTCTLDCEIDLILGFGAAGESLQATLESNGLVDADCINIDHFGYGMVSTINEAERLKLGLRSHNQKNDGSGGRNLCDEDVKLTPSVSGG